MYKRRDVICRIKIKARLELELKAANHPESLFGYDVKFDITQFLISPFQKREVNTFFIILRENAENMKWLKNS